MEPHGARQGEVAEDPGVAADDARLEPLAEVEDAGPVEHDRVLDLGALDLHVGADRRVRADVGILDLRAGADDDRAADDRGAHRGGRIDDDAALDAGSLTHLWLAIDLETFEDHTVEVEQVLDLAVVAAPGPHHADVNVPAG